jgi:hypothetical protein
MDSRKAVEAEDQYTDYWLELRSLRFAFSLDYTVALTRLGGDRGGEARGESL